MWNFWSRRAALVMEAAVLRLKLADLVVGAASLPLLLEQRGGVFWWRRETLLCFVFPPLPFFYCINITRWTRAFIFDTCWRNFFFCVCVCVCACVGVCPMTRWCLLPRHTFFFFFRMLDDLMWCETLRVGRERKKKKPWKAKRLLER